MVVGHVGPCETACLAGSLTPHPANPAPLIFTMPQIVNQRIKTRTCHIGIVGKIPIGVEVRARIPPFFSSMLQEVRSCVSATRPHVRIFVEIPIWVEIGRRADEPLITLMLQDLPNMETNLKTHCPPQQL